MNHPATLPDGGKGVRMLNCSMEDEPWNLIQITTAKTV